ncbi:hypothetical protein C2E21_3459 [Chlorella sorokiniana]|uniref:Uncharacterized protein n=1 Tax=Chlorella sorokiniana TaxID=3076 RepID=A0A2P6TV78_CHLSO|nr:hypothetical protein C2E21_3459 [Chlorella sorokiniana]|eukprot:PRW57958.1 hypothetical protein C2E21_3459 [Chlorella sorokiniana]
MAEVNAGVTADTPGSAFAVWNAALQHAKQMNSEVTAIKAHLADPSQPMPDPTPPLRVTLPSLHATSAAPPPAQPSSSACGVQPDTPAADASLQQGLLRGGDSSSSEEAAASACQANKKRDASHQSPPSRPITADA